MSPAPLPQLRAALCSPEERSLRLLTRKKGSLAPSGPSGWTEERRGARWGLPRRSLPFHTDGRAGVPGAGVGGGGGGGGVVVVPASMMKFKPNQTRTYDREGFKKRAACLCFRSEREEEVRVGFCKAAA